MTDGRATSNSPTTCHCFQYQTWCDDCKAGREWEATRRKLASGPKDIYLAFLRGERDG